MPRPVPTRRAAGPVLDLADGVERGVVAVLRDDGAELEEQRRVVVPEADEVEQHLRIGGADDLLVVVGPFTADGLGTETSGAAARKQREQDWNRDGAKRHAFHLAGYWLRYARASRIGALESWISPPTGWANLQDQEDRRLRSRSSRRTAP